MSLRTTIRFLALAACLPGLAGWVGCATGGGNWDQPHESQPRQPKQEFMFDFQKDMNALWEEAYGLAPGELMGPFWIEPVGPPQDEAVFLGPYFEEADTEEPPDSYQSIIFQFSVSGLDDDNPPGFLTGSIFLCSGHELVADPVVSLLGLYYAEGRDAWGRSRPEGMGAISEIGIDFGLRGYLLSGTPGQGPYCIMGFRLGGMDWSYTPTDDEDGSDGLGDYEGSGTITTGTFYTGVGVPVIRVGPTRLGLNATLGYRGLDLKYEGQLERELFSQNQMLFRLDVEVVFPF